MNKNVVVETYYRENYSTLVKVARRRVGDYSLVLAEEAVQEAFCRCLKYYKTYNQNDKFDSWFRRILYNTINHIKTQEKNGGVVSNEREEETTNQGDVAFTKEVIDMLSHCSARDQEILNNYFFYGFKTREISELMNVSHDIIRDRIRTFRDRVRK